MNRYRLPCLLLCLLLLWAPVSALGEAAYPTLAVGARGEEVLRMQRRLAEAGFYAGAEDGIFGTGTRDAVLLLQQALRKAGKPVAADGAAGPQTLAFLYDDEVMRPFIDFGEGTQGRRVAALQNRLIDLKFLRGQADGAFGPLTTKALREFQEHVASFGAPGVTVSGVADAPTRALLAPGADLAPYSIIAPEFFNESAPLGLRDEYLYSQASILIDTQTGEVLYAKDSQERMYPASTTKLMTLLVALEEGDPYREVTIPKSAAQVPSDSSLTPVYPGEKMRMWDLLHGMMLRSGNDAANAVAELTAGSVNAFVDRMNRKAQFLGMAGTHFTNAHGYHDPEHYTTARDLVILGAYIMRKPQALAVATALQYELPATSKREALLLTTGSEMLNPLSGEHYPPAFGLKSGYTQAAGFCYVGGASKDGRALCAVILRTRTRSQGWTDLRRLFEYGFARLGN